MVRNLDFNFANVADTASGHFLFAGPRDQWLIDRTRQWCAIYTVGRWRFRIDMAAQVITFYFELQQDADRFRQETARSRDLITCV